MSEKKRSSKGPSGMSQWQMQIEGGRTLGPLSTQDLLLKISEGQLSGEEMIRKLPDGAWNRVSKEPIFFDHLLKVIEGDGKPINTKPAAKKRPDPVTQVKPKLPSETVAAPIRGPLISSPIPVSNINQIVQKPRVDTPQKYVPPSQPIQIQGPKVISKKKSGLLPMVLALVLVVVAYLTWDNFFAENSGDSYTGLRIKAPRPGTKNVLTEADQQKAMSEIYRYLFHDSVLEYNRAQTLLIQYIEKMPVAAEPRGLLCLVQMNLWPYVRQNSTDLDNLKQAKIAGSRIDPVGLSGIHCEVSYLMVLGKYRDAQGVIEHTSNRRDIGEESPVLYSTKAEIFASQKNYAEAIAWAEAAAKLWPQWVHPYYQMGIYNFEIAQNEKAIESFERALNLFPKHRASLIEYGILLELAQKDSTRALQFLTVAMNSTDPVSKLQEAKMYYYLGKILADQKQTQKALEYVTKSFQLNAGDLKTRDLLIQLGGSPNNISQTNQNNELVFLGDQYFRAGDFLAAQAEYKTAFETDPKNALAAMKAAKSLWQLYQAEEAIKWLGKSISADPKFSIPYFLMADYYSSLYNFSSAGEILSRGALKLQNNPDIIRGYGLVELRSHNYKAAIQNLERALKLTQDADTLILLAKAYLSTGDPADTQKALANATKAIQLEDANPDAQVIYAKVLASTNGYAAAITYLKERSLKYSYTTDYTLGLAEIYKEAEQYNLAQVEFEKVFLLDNKNKRALMGLGTCYQEQGLLEKSLKMFLLSGVEDPSDPEPVFKAGQVYMDAGRYQEAFHQFQRGLNINKVYPRGYYYLGRAALKLKNYNAALEAASEEKRNNPGIADAYILAGETYKENHEYAKCGAEYLGAVRLRPKGAENYVKLAQCQIWAGNLEIAENMLSIAKEQESGYADIYKLQGAIFEKKAEIQEACVAYQNYLSLAPNAADKKDFEAKVSGLCGK